VSLVKGTSAIVGATALVVTVLACVTVLLALGKDPTPLLGAIGILVTPVIGAMLAKRLDTIEQHVNGNTSRLLGIAERAAAATPPDGPKAPEEDDPS
jgi:multisubunit Na+/H+ antiporter MnhB subunit